LDVSPYLDGNFDQIDGIKNNSLSFFSIKNTEVLMVAYIGRFREFLIFFKRKCEILFQVLFEEFCCFYEASDLQIKVNDFEEAICSHFYAPVLEFKEKHQIGGEARHFKFKFFEFGDIF
jgi:hypothetical protein